MKTRHLSGLIAVFLFSRGIAPAQEILSYYAQIPRSTTDWAPAKALQVPGFDASLGTLTGVELTYSGEIWQSLFFENTSPSSSATYDLLTLTTLTFGEVGGPVLIDNTASPTSFHKSGVVGRFDGTLDSAGTSGVTFNQDTVMNGVYNDPNLAGYISSGPIGFSATTLGSFSMTASGGNNSAGVSTSAAVDLQVEYSYTPIPEPAAYSVVLGLAALGLVLRRRERDFSDPVDGRKSGLKEV